MCLPLFCKPVPPFPLLPPDSPCLSLDWKQLFISTSPPFDMRRRTWCLRENFFCEFCKILGNMKSYLKRLPGHLLHLLYIVWNKFVECAYMCKKNKRYNSCTLNEAIEAKVFLCKRVTCVCWATIVAWMQFYVISIHLSEYIIYA